MRQIDPGNTKLIYVTYHVDVGETPFLIGVDYTMRSIVVSIRGTLSLKVSSKISKWHLQMKVDSRKYYYLSNISMIISSKMIINLRFQFVIAAFDIKAFKMLSTFSLKSK